MHKRIFFYKTYGFPLELTEEFLTESGYSIEDKASYVDAAKKHAEKSRTASAGKFKGGLADQSTETTELHKTEAKESGVEGNFWDKYPDIVKVYTIKNNEGNVWSREICGGPHVEDTTNLGKFSVEKEQSSSAGVRRIKGVISK